MKNKKTYLIERDYFTIFSYVFWLFLIILSILFAKERILISDPAHYFFTIVNSSDFMVPFTRYTSVINQGLLVLATRLHLPLYLLLIVYSVSFVLVRVVYFFLVTNILKNKAAGFAVIAVSAIGIAESYFRPTSESHIALLNSILLYAWMCYSCKKLNWGKWQLPISLFFAFALIVFGYFSHALALFSLLFSILFFMLEKKKANTVLPYLTIIFTLCLFLFKIFIGDNDVQHKALYGNTLEAQLDVIKNISHYYPYHFFKNNFGTIFFPFVFLFFSAILLSFKKNKWLSSVFFVLYSLFYFLVACASYKNGDMNMQMEKIFLPLVMFAALPFFESVNNYSGRKRFTYGCVGIFLIILGLSRTNNFLPIYKNRIDTIHNVVVKSADKLSNRKLVISYKQIKDYPLLGSWAFGIETLILSTIDKEMEPLTVFLTNHDVEERMKLRDNFMSVEFQTSFNYNSFNKDYFELPEQEYIYWDVDFDFKKNE